MSSFKERGSSVHKAQSVLICCCPRNREKGPGPAPSHDTNTGQRAAGHLAGAVHHTQNKMCSYASIRRLSSWPELFPPTRSSSRTSSGEGGGRGGAQAQSKHLLQAVPGQGGLKTLCWGPDPQCPQAHFIDEKNEAPEKAEPDLGPRILSSTAPNHTAHKVPEIHIYSHKKKNPQRKEKRM